MNEVVMKRKLRADKSVELEARLKTVWIVAKSDKDYPYFKVIGVYSDEEGALKFAAETAAFPASRGLYWKAQEVVWSKKKIKDHE